MKISYNWLKQYINFHQNAAEIGALLTAGGLEVEGVCQALDNLLFPYESQYPMPVKCF